MRNNQPQKNFASGAKTTKLPPEVEFQKKSIVFCSSAQHLNPSLADVLQAKKIETKLHYFTAGEALVTINSKCEDHVYIVQSFGLDTNNAIIEFLLTVNAARNAGAQYIHAIILYMAYSRQDRMLEEYSSIGIQIVADLLNHSGVNNLTTIDIHEPNSMNLFNMPSTNISGIEIAKAKSLHVNKLVVLPDHGGLKRIGDLDTDFVYFTKKRYKTKLALELHGDVKGKDCLIIDDIIDSGRTICAASEILTKYGARSVKAFVTHALFSEATYALIDKSQISHITISNTIDNECNIPKIVEVVDISGIIGLI